MRRLRRRYGHARKASGWAPGDHARTIAKIPADPYPLFPPAVVTVEEVRKLRGSRRKDSFGQWETSGGGTRVRVHVDGGPTATAHLGKSYWVDAEILERP